MKSKYILSILGLLLFHYVSGQTNNPWFFEDGHLMQSLSANSSNYAPYGEAFTPKGDLRVLIICAGFGAPYDNYTSGSWATGSTSLPNWVSDKSTFYNNISDFDNYSNLNNNTNVSRFYYEMSKQQFRLIADVYPQRINIDATGATSWYTLTQRVFEKMKTDDPNFDWSPYDNRTNYPNYQYDGSNSSPDLKPDYVVVIFRYNDNWTNKPVSGMSSWSGSQGGYAALYTPLNFSYNNYTFHDYCGYTHCLGTSSPYGLFIHEVAHNLFDCPHYAMANSIVGNYFYGQQGGWGMMNLGYVFNSAIGWERWYLNWIDLESNGISSDIQNASNLPANGEFILRDHITTGDVVRIKLNNGSGSNQYLWLENHAGSSIFDERGWDNNDACSNTFPLSPTGLVAYIESINDNKSTTSIFNSGANGIKYIHPLGNFDYSYSLAPDSDYCLWNNLVTSFAEVEANPISGQSRIEMIRSDFNSNNSIYLNVGTNSTSPHNEQIWVAKRNGYYTWDFLGAGLTFPTGKKIGMDTNPCLASRPQYTSSSSLMGYSYLNGISVTKLADLSGGRIQIKVEFDDVDIQCNVRWTGNVALNNITNNTNPDLILNSGYKITINKSGTPNRTTKVDNDFINYTNFRCESGSYFKIEPNSKVLLDENSTFTLQSGSTLEIEDGAEFVVMNDSKLVVETGASVVVKGRGGITFKCNGKLCASSGASINLQNTLSSIHFIGTGGLSSGCLSSLSSVLCGSGSVRNYSSALTVSNATINSDTYYSGSAITSTNVSVQGSGTDLIYSTTNGATINGPFGVPIGSTFEVRVNPTSCTN